MSVTNEEMARAAEACRTCGAVPSPTFHLCECPHLLPCPFCGGSAGFGVAKYSATTAKQNKWKQSVFHYINCVVCGVSNVGLVGYLTYEIAAEKWNQRQETP